jgi:hypothetical protein
MVGHRSQPTFSASMRENEQCRVEGESPDWTMKHVRAGQEVFEAEILSCGFKKVREHSDLLKENYFIEFERVAP